jgi:hypothetical protein
MGRGGALSLRREAGGVMQMEEWHPIPGFPGYEASSCGRIRSWRSCHGTLREPLTRRLQQGPDGYLRIKLRRRGRCHLVYVHRFIARTFHGERPANMECRHLDGNRLNNAIDNLRWGTRQENAADKARHGRSKGNAGSVKLCPESVRAIRLMCADGERPTEVAKRFNVHRATVYGILRKQVWSHVI